MVDRGIEIEPLWEFCRSLPATTEDVKWEDHLAFCVGEKMYAIFQVSGEPPFSLKASAEAFEQLTAQPGVIPAPYLARAQWVQIRHDCRLPAEMLRELLTEAHELVASKLSKRLRRELGLLVD